MLATDDNNQHPYDCFVDKLIRACKIPFSRINHYFFVPLMKIKFSVYRRQ